MKAVKFQAMASVVAAALVLLAGCASAPIEVPKVEPPPPEPKAALEDNAFISFKRIILGNGGALYIAPDTAFESYDNWIIDKVDIEFHPEQLPLTATEQAELKILMLKARVGQAKAYGSVVREPSTCTLTQQLHLKKLLLYKSGKSGPQVNFVSSLGEAVIVAEIKDSMTGRTVFAYIEPIQLGRGVTKSASPDMERLGEILGEVMQRSYRALVEEIPVDPDNIADRAAQGCNGQIGKNLHEIRSVLRDKAAAKVE
ncbi:MAG: hypothetical protein HKO71_08860 [Pseudomonadales bacterium]|nr:hypothetical protein [Pseudomonadales bacterium]